MILRWFLPVGFAAAAAAGPVEFRVEAYSSCTDNLFQNYHRRSEWMTLTYVDLDFAVRPGLDLYYTGNADLFAEYGELFNHTHRAGMTWTRRGEGRRSAVVGLSVAVRQNRAAYRYRDYVQGEGFASLKRYLKSGLLRMGYSMRSRVYLHKGDFSYAEQVVSGRISRFLPSRTTLAAGVEIGIKTFLRSRPDSRRVLVQGRMQGKIAQTLFPGMGAQVEYRRRVNARAGNRYDEPEFDPDEELFDDRYSYEGGEWRGRLKYVRGRGFQLSLSGSAVLRRYDRPALDLDGAPLGTVREDRRRRVSVSCLRCFPLQSGRLYGLEVRLEGTYVKVRSTDPYYDATARIGAVGLAVEF